MQCRLHSYSSRARQHDDDLDHTDQANIYLPNLTYLDHNLAHEVGVRDLCPLLE